MLLFSTTTLIIGNEKPYNKQQNIESSRGMGWVAITRPHEGAFYVFDREISNFSVTNIICIMGKITVFASTVSPDDTLEINFSIDGFDMHRCYLEPYVWRWNTCEYGFGMHAITVYALNNDLRLFNDTLDVFVLSLKR